MGCESLSDPDQVFYTHTWRKRKLDETKIAGSTAGTEDLIGQWCDIAAPLGTGLPTDPFHTFDIASCQFAMHYMFQTESKANHFFAHVSSRALLYTVR